MPASGSISGSQDAFYCANGTTTSASTNLVIQSAAVIMPDSLHYRFTIKVQNLSSLVVSPTLGGTDAVWLVRREEPDPNGAGHIYFAGMESDGGAAPNFRRRNTVHQHHTRQVSDVSTCAHHPG
jgi:hypothetical protein